MKMTTFYVIPSAEAKKPCESASRRSAHRGARVRAYKTVGVFGGRGG